VLSSLSVRNLGIVESVTAEFGEGLNIITGETGAGKSLLIDALSIIRGMRFGQQFIGPFGSQSQVTAVFEVPLKHRVWEKLAAWELCEPVPVGRAAGGRAAKGEVVIRRVCTAQGKSRHFINDVPVQLRTLVEVSSELVDISSQFENQRLLDERSHLTYLDAFADLHFERDGFQRNFESLHADLIEIGQLEKRKQILLREKELLESELMEIEALVPSEDEFDRLMAEVARTQRVVHAVQELEQLSVGLADGQGGCLVTLRHAHKKLQKLLVQFPNDVPAGLAEAALRAVLEVEELSYQIDALKASMDVSPSEAAANEARLQSYSRLMARFGDSVGDLLAHADRARCALSELEGLDFRIEDKARDINIRVLRLVEQSRSLTKRRVAVVKALQRAVEAELKDLGMVQARFQCELRAHDEPQVIHYPHQALLSRLVADGEVLDAFLLLSRNGAEKVRFLIAPNPGSPPAPLKDIASGGELSRLMLSIKKVLFESDSMSVFVFDEIDTGISGSVAAMVGLKLSQFCKGRQAIVVTHLPQVACFGSDHFIVSKRNRKSQTVTQIERANSADRRKELAQMISGVKVTAESLAQADQLLQEAHEKAGVQLNA
jgi:DNA repair protein RecN (Recombination protein N)